MCGGVGLTRGQAGEGRSGRVAVLCFTLSPACAVTAQTISAAETRDSIRDFPQGRRPSVSALCS
jgi:hypothetical protein